MQIRRETSADIEDIYNVNERAFERAEEAELVDRLRDSGAVTLSLVAVENDCIVGHILFTPVTIESDDAKHDALTLGPIAVLPENQRRGIGSRLIEYAFEGCRRLGHKIVVLVGHPGYYPRFGFVQAASKGLICEYDGVRDEVWMVAELVPGALDGVSGVVRFRPEFTEAM